MAARRNLMTIFALSGAIAMAGCEHLDMDSLFSPKKPLPGDRREMFPQGVPGVQSGVPSDLVRGNQQPVAEAPPAPPPEPEKPKPKPARRAAAPAKPRPATSVTVQPSQQQASEQQAPAQQPSQAAWPAPPARAPSQQPSSGAPSTAAWPDPPRPATTTR